MAEPAKEYNVRVRVRLSADLLPVPAVSAAELQELLEERLDAGTSGSPVISVAVSDPAGKRPRRRY